MKKDDIIRILYDWNFWEKDLVVGVVRDDYLNRLKGFLANDQPIIITGARRSGKSFIMRQLARHLIYIERVQKNRILIVNFEDPRFSALTTDTLQSIFNTYLEYVRPTGRPYIFLDEIQEVAQWEKWVLMMQELGKATIILSGSNAHLLSRELATVLTGRHLTVEVFPLSFKEFLEFKNVESGSRPNQASKEIVALSFFREYLEYGGFPEVVTHPNKKEILLGYFQDIIEKDLIGRYRIRKGETIKELARFLFSNISKLHTYSSLGKFLGVSTDTAKRFSHYLENIYLTHSLQRFSYTIKEQIKSPHKVYAFDHGLARAVGFAFTDNKGRGLENLVCLELLRRQSRDPNIELFYWKDVEHYEVDFVIKKNNRIEELIQVVWDMSDANTKKREESALWKAMRDLRVSKGTIITEEDAEVLRKDDVTVEVIPFTAWLAR